eukprot:gene11289-biopygen1851
MPKMLRWATTLNLGLAGRTRKRMLQFLGEHGLAPSRHKGVSVPHVRQLARACGLVAMVFGGPWQLGRPPGPSGQRRRATRLCLPNGWCRCGAALSGHLNGVGWRCTRDVCVYARLWAVAVASPG